MTNEKRMPKELHQIQEKTKFTHTNSRMVGEKKKNVNLLRNDPNWEKFFLCTQHTNVRMALTHTSRSQCSRGIYSEINNMDTQWKNEQYKSE